MRRCLPTERIDFLLTPWMDLGAAPNRLTGREFSLTLTPSPNFCN
jgi:hypothetical protein